MRCPIEEGRVRITPLEMITGVASEVLGHWHPVKKKIASIICAIWMFGEIGFSASMPITALLWINASMGPFRSGHLSFYTLVSNY
jgi:hypothetical protein